MVSCAACGCSSTPKNKSLGITFHNFPKDCQKSKLWTNFVNKPDWTPLKTSFLCSQHFTNECFDRTSKLKVRLWSHALPTITVNRLKYVRKYNTTQLHIESPENHDEPLPGPSFRAKTPTLPPKYFINPSSEDTQLKRQLERKIIDLQKESALKSMEIRKLQKIAWRQKKRIDSLKSMELMEEIHIKEEIDTESNVSNQSVENCPEEIDPESCNGSNPSIESYPESPLSKCPKIEIVFDQEEMNSVYGECFENEFDNFGNDVANKLKELPHETAIVTQKLIDALLTESHLGNVTRYTKVILEDVRPP